MADTIDKKTLEQIIIQLSNKIARLQSGGRPIIGRSAITTIEPIALSANASAVFEATLEWPNENVEAILGAVPYFDIHVDVPTGDSNRWPHGPSLTPGQRELEFDWLLDLDLLTTVKNKATVRGKIKNSDSADHIYCIDVGFTYVAGASSSQ